MPRWIYRSAILVAGLFLIFQGMGIAHATSEQDQSDHIECVLCHVMSEQVEAAIIPVSDAATEDLNQISLPTDYNVIPQNIGALTPPERAPPPRGPPSTHI